MDSSENRIRWKSSYKEFMKSLTKKMAFGFLLTGFGHEALQKKKPRLIYG
ncbi:MAG: hypothetical protein ABIP98_01540 [Ginsengibacter sp.]